jgi:hypothetical protein
MISKVIKPAKNFARICRYLLHQREEAKVVLSEGVRDYDHGKMAEDFQMQAAANPELSSPVQHIILSFPPGEDLEEEKLAQIAREYLQELQLNKTQYVAVLHREKEHQHVHVVLNRVSNNGKTIKDSFLGLRGKKKAQELTQRHELKPALRKDLKQTNVRQMNLYDQSRYEIYKAVREGIVKTTNLNELEVWLGRRQIEVIYKYKGQTTEIQGMSFKRGVLKYKASDIDRRFSYKNLEKIYTYELQRNRVLEPSLTDHLSDHVKQSLRELAEILMRPEETINYIPIELIKKRKQSQSKGLHL